MSGLSKMWKHARASVDLVVSIPAPTIPAASCCSRVTDSSSGGKSDAIRLPNTVLCAIIFMCLVLATLYFEDLGFDFLRVDWHHSVHSREESWYRSGEAYILKLKDWYYCWINDF